MHKTITIAAFVIAISAPLAFAQQADLMVVKTGPAIAADGTDVPYNVTVTNLGPDGAVSVTLTDGVPPGMTFVSHVSDPSFVCSTPAVGAGGTISCTNALFANGASANFTFVFHIPAGTFPGTSFINTAVVSSPTSDPDNDNNTSIVVTSTPAPPQADLTVSKTGPDFSAADTDVSYDVTITNTGPDAATAIALADNGAPPMTFVSHTSDPAFSCTTPAVGASGPINCTGPILASGASANFTFVFHIPPATPPGTTFTNVATVTTATTDPTSENDSASASTSTPPPPQADMLVSKSGPSSAGPDTDVVYTIAVTNAGPDAASDVELEDVLPGTMTFVSIVQDGGPGVSCTTPAGGFGGTVTCSAATFAAATTVTFTLTGHIPAGTTSGTTFQNDATVTATTEDPNPENDSASTVLIVSSVDISVTKSGPANVTAGQDITYTVIVANAAGSDIAVSVNLSDPLPPDTTFVSLTQDNGPAASCAAVSGNVSCDFQTFPDAMSAQFTIVITAGNTTSVVNTATVTSQSFDVDMSNDTDSVTTTVTPSADLSVVKTGPPTVTPGATVQYTITAMNNGPSDASSVSVSDTLPPNTTLVSMTQTTGPTFACAGTTCSIALLEVDDTATFTVVAQLASSIANGTSVTNTATISTATGDPNNTNDTSMTTATAATSADLSISKAGPATVTSGANVQYTITAMNNGPSDASNVSVSDTLPPNTTFVSMTQNTGPALACASTTCTIATFPAGATATFTVIAQVAPTVASGTSVTNGATIASGTSDPNNTNDTSTTTATAATSANVAVAKSGPATVTPGTNVSYTITATNAGPSDASTVSVTDTLPPNSTLVSMTQNTGPTFACATTTCTIATFAAGSTATFSLTVALASSVPSGTSVTNTANIATTTPDPSNTNNTATSTATATPSADLSVVKNGPATATSGANAQYTITLTSIGPSDAANVSLTDTLPANTTLVSMTQTTGPAFACAANTCTIASFATGATATFTVVAQLSPSIASGASVTNSATASAATPDPNNLNNTSMTTATATTSADVSIAKAGPATVTAGLNETYTITVTNGGPSDAANVAVTEVPPPQTTFLSMTQTSGPTFTCAAMTCSIASFPAGATATFDVVLNISPTATAPLANSATVTSITPDPNATNGAASSPAAAVAPPIIDLSISKTANGSAFSGGENVTYTIVVTNNGPFDATNVVVEDPIPPGATFVSATPSQGSCSGAPTVTCSLGSLAANANATISLVMTLPRFDGMFSNTATVSSDNGELNPANNTSTATIAVALNIPALSPIALIILGAVLAALGFVVLRKVS